MEVEVKVERVWLVEVEGAVWGLGVSVVEVAVVVMVVLVVVVVVMVAQALMICPSYHYYHVFDHHNSLCRHGDARC